MKQLLCMCLLALAATQLLAAETDGPYVVRNAAGKLESWSVDATGDAPKKRVMPAAVGEKLTIPAVGRLPAFQVVLRAPAANSPDVITAGAKAPLFVVADTHGEYEILAGMLMSQHIVDKDLRWSFAKGRLVILGDAVDRGPNQVEILWLIYGLEAQARKAGGAVYFMLGNHETMLMRGDLRYLNAKYRETAQVLGVEYAQLFDADSVLGQWLRSRPAVLKLNQYLCLHGGISPQVVDRNMTLADINGAVRASLNGVKPEADSQREREAFVFGEQGPLWYRGYFPESTRTAATADDIERIRRHFAVEKILVGHTTVPTITPLFDGQVIAVQVYPKLDSFGNPIFEALSIRDGVLARAKPDGKTDPLGAGVSN